jgi:hypothetical protein
MHTTGQGTPEIKERKVDNTQIKLAYSFTLHRNKFAFMAAQYEDLTKNKTKKMEYKPLWR